MPSDPKNRFATRSRAFATPSCALLNRDFQPPADGWFQIVPIGEFRNMGIVDGKEQEIVQVLDRAAIDALAKNFSGELLVDYEHFAHDPDKETRAAGWITGVQARDDGLYAQIRFSNSGKADMTGGDYRFISPEFDRGGPIEGDRWRPSHLSGAAFTNKPNLTTLKPLSNREPEESGQINNENTTTMDYKAIILKVLGLPDTATDEEIQAAADKLGEKPAPEMAQEVETTNRQLAELRDAMAERDMDGLDLDDETKKTVKDTLMRNRKGGLKLIETLRKNAAPAEQPAPLFNRTRATPPKTGSALSEASKAEEERAAKVQNRAHEINRTERCGFTMAWNRAEAEIPAVTGK